MGGLSPVTLFSNVVLAFLWPWPLLINYIYIFKGFTMYRGVQAPSSLTAAFLLTPRTLLSPPPFPLAWMCVPTFFWWTWGPACPWRPWAVRGLLLIRSEAAHLLNHVFHETGFRTCPCSSGASACFLVVTSWALMRPQQSHGSRSSVAPSAEAFPTNYPENNWLGFWLGLHWICISIREEMTSYWVLTIILEYLFLLWFHLLALQISS